MAKTRDRRLDVLKGLLITGVVLGHFLETSGGGPPSGLYPGWDHEPQRTVLTFLYLFHMPLFIFLAGITARERDLVHRVVQMVGLFTVLQVAYLLIRPQYELTLDAFVHPVYGLWFLLAMGWWLATLPIVRRLGHWALPVALVVSLAAVVAPFSDTDIGAWSRAVCYWPFFVAGQLYGTQVLRRTAPTRVLRMLAAAVVGAGVTGAVMLSGLDPNWFRGDSIAATMNETDGTAVLARMVSLVAAVTLSWAVLTLVPRHLALVEGLGRRSLGVYALHIPVVFFAQAWFEDVGLAMWPASGVAVLMTVATLSVLRLPVFDRAVRTTAGTVADVVVPDALRPDEVREGELSSRS
jgi:fucose 4-O-acetylase-like acetyltransferase